MLDAELLNILCCPETHQALSLAEQPLIDKLNRQVASGELRTRAGQTVQEPLDGGLIRSDQKFLYPIRQDIPILLIDEAIPLAP